MNTPLISVIIPVYNAERFLSAALDSVLAQTYKNWELILIDDGSTDQSGAICDQYAAQHPEQVSVTHQRNQGVSVARNVGMSLAKGEFIAFMDADDLITPGYLQLLCSRQQETNADLVIVGAKMINSYNQSTISVDDYDDMVYATESFPFILNKNLFGSVWKKLMKRTLIRRYDLVFNPDISLGEDSLFITSYISVCNIIATIGKVAYYYRRGHDSLSWAAYRYGQKDMIYRIEKIRHFLEKNNIKTEFAIGLIDFHYYNLLRTTIDSRWTFSETRDNLISMGGDKGFCEYLSQVKNDNLTKLEQFYVYILKRIASPPSSLCIVLLVFLLLRITQRIGYMRSCWGKRCKCDNKM